MLDRLIRPLRRSFSAKVIALVIASGVVTSAVVGIATMRSTQTFLYEKTSEKFPSILTTSKSKVKIWYERRFRELERLSQAEVFLENLKWHNERPESADPDPNVLSELVKYVSIVHDKFPVYEELMVLGIDGEVIASTSRVSESVADSLFYLILESGESIRISPAISSPGDDSVHQWLFTTIKSQEGRGAMMVAKVDLEEFTNLLADIHLGTGGDLFLLDPQGRYLTRPRFAASSKLGQRAMQVPTRDTGQVVVEKRSNYDDRVVLRGLTRIDETGWWVVYDEDYRTAMEPVINARYRMWISILFIGMVFVLAALKIVKSILRPINDLALGAQRINEGLVGVKIPSGGDDVIGMMIETFNEMAKTITLSKAELQYKNKMLNTQNDQLQDMNQKLEELSITDGLTGLFNHRHFWNLLNTELTRVDLYQGDLALVLIDLDDFKRINDQFGHAVGDLLLQAVSTVLKEAVRGTDIVARYGGEEFAILLPDTDIDGMQMVSEKLRANVETMRFKIPETDIVLSITISLGASVFRGNRRDFFNAADRALYLSKSEGKNRVNYALNE